MYVPQPSAGLVSGANKWALPRELVDEFLRMAKPSLLLRVKMLVLENKHTALLIGILEDQEKALYIKEMLIQQKETHQEILKLLALLPAPIQE